MSNWDKRFLALAKTIGAWSKDRSRGVGCVIVGPNKEIRATGFNGFPRWVNDDMEDRHERPAKYRWTEHAERNAIYNAVYSGVSLAGCAAYVPWFPCMDCARALIQSGIITLVAYEPDLTDERWGFAEVKEMLQEAGMDIRLYEGKEEC